MLGFVKVGHAGDGEAVNKANIFRGHTRAGCFQVPGGTHGGVLTRRQAERPRPGRFADLVQGPLSAAFLVPPHCLRPLGTTYRSRALGVQSLPHHQATPTEEAERTRRCRADAPVRSRASATAKDQVNSRNQTARALAGKGSTHSPPRPCHLRCLCIPIG